MLLPDGHKVGDFFCGSVVRVVGALTAPAGPPNAGVMVPRSKRRHFSGIGATPTIARVRFAPSGRTTLREFRDQI